ncbi:sugar phosphate isomerase/epimerase family protein [Terriglobus roseus]|uniref:Sugar phosphate isomerase/epimerase n=1 Tax=Terriglobus roseus TaxID=392734 RepID=A0A1H4KH91_9BACT|nr:sugar phosphate isomerase/epimerase [Terriglobus roseus]SEB57924.1 Sugar phosphate isomerase/epimerase [Terriglobus roseus]
MNSITRRQFLSRTGTVAALAASAAVLPRWAFADPLGLPLGIQLYVVGADMQKDAAAAVKQIAAIGYKEVETAGFGSLKTAKELRKAFDDNGLKCPSAHLPLKLDALQASFDDANTLGCTYATSSVPQGWLAPPMPAMDPNMTADQRREAMAKARGGMLAPLDADKTKALAEDMNKVGEAAKKAGLKFAAHNHTMEFGMVDGKPAYDYLITHTDKDLVTFEIDCGWMTVAGYKPADFVAKYPGRIRMLHIKDFLPYPKGASTGGPIRPEGSEIGQGVVNYKEIFAGVKGKGIQHIFVEQEGPYSRMPAMEAAAVDYKYLHAIS